MSYKMQQSLRYERERALINNAFSALLLLLPIKLMRKECTTLFQEKQINSLAEKPDRNKLVVITKSLPFSF